MTEKILLKNDTICNCKRKIGLFVRSVLSVCIYSHHHWLHGDVDTRLPAPLWSVLRAISVNRKFCMCTLCFFQRFRQELGLGLWRVLHPRRVRNNSFGVRLFDRSDWQPSFHGQGCIHVFLFIICTCIISNFYYFLLVEDAMPRELVYVNT